MSTKRANLRITLSGAWRCVNIQLSFDYEIVGFFGINIGLLIVNVQDRGKQVSGEGNTSGTVDSRVGAS